MKKKQSSFSALIVAIAVLLTVLAIIAVFSTPVFGQVEDSDPYKATAARAPSMADAPLEFQVISQRKMINGAYQYAGLTAVIRGRAKVITQDLTQRQRADLCKGKKDLLQRYEREAVLIKKQIEIWQVERDRLLNLVNSSRDHLYRVKENCITEYLIHSDKLKQQLSPEEMESEDLQLRIAAENLKLVHNLPLWTRDLPPSRQLIASSSIYQQTENQLRLLSFAQQRVNNQIWTLRAAIDSLRCERGE